MVLEQGDLIYINFSPQSGHEQRGMRPAIVLSPSLFNQGAFIAVCPITKEKKGYPFEIELPDDLPVYGVILTDQIRTLDWRSRSAGLKGKAPQEIVEKCFNRIHTYLTMDER
ncbi:type II toxin-antitoxin system PemK/MazF family toxin [Lentibacillus sp. CBA3610]|uniref:type II toxin-antitoxin system PemK/MazF family toxin n=1 Tax=Lentibacillus sp. CBA3610 TaxID=2518176 RepID=UPI001595011D|nr:type II toxin-antitoxin system PemK/MazF family toxin [Lentibacillus sp. CBA3610]QKY71382.1 mRNA-degrading endonuclease [Lentibacillus sp. CBA3610]